MKIIWLPLATRHLDDVFDFLYERNPVAAVNRYNEILDRAEKLSASPLVASVELLLEKEPEMFRSLVILRRYKAIYFIEDETIKIADIWDCRRNPDTLKTGIKKKK